MQLVRTSQAPRFYCHSGTSPPMIRQIINHPRKRDMPKVPMRGERKPISKVCRHPLILIPTPNLKVPIRKRPRQNKLQMTALLALKSLSSKMMERHSRTRMQVLYRQQAAIKDPIQNSRSLKHPKAGAKKRAGRKSRAKRKSWSHRQQWCLKWLLRALILLNLLRILAA
jgi:hypothetical protein